MLILQFIKKTLVCESREKDKFNSLSFSISAALEKFIQRNTMDFINRKYKFNRHDDQFDTYLAAIGKIYLNSTRILVIL